MAFAQRTCSKALPWNQVRISPSPFPRGKPCRARVIPVAGYLLHKRKRSGIRFETMLRRFRVGSLARRSKFLLHTLPLRRSFHNKSRHCCRLLCSILFCYIGLYKSEISNEAEEEVQYSIREGQRVEVDVAAAAGKYAGVGRCQNRYNNGNRLRNNPQPAEEHIDNHAGC